MDAAKHLTIHRIAPTVKTHPASNVNRAAIKSRCRVFELRNLRIYSFTQQIFTEYCAGECEGYGNNTPDCVTKVSV